jgi:hypothetical protein
LVFKNSCPLFQWITHAKADKVGAKKKKNRIINLQSHFRKRMELLFIENMPYARFHDRFFSIRKKIYHFFRTASSNSETLIDQNPSP